MTIRISLVHYLNAAPLGWAFLHGPMKDEFEVIPSSPARCADQLAAGEVDIGLIPSFAYQRIPGLEVLPGMAIAAVRKVRSVLMIRHRGMGAIRSVALDTSSRTSQALIQVLLNLKMKLHPEIVDHPPQLEEMLRRCDTALLIGDAALRASQEDYDILDLAEAWIEWQHRPFVFAFWACRSEVKGKGALIGKFQAAKDWGLARTREIAEEYSRTLNLPMGFLQEYLLRNVDYDLTPHHVEGLNRFYELAHEAGLVPAVRPVKFV